MHFAMSALEGVGMAADALLDVKNVAGGGTSSQADLQKDNGSRNLRSYFQMAEFA